MSDKIIRKKWGSDQISANKKGYSVGKVAAGVILIGNIELIASAHESGNIVIACLKYGNHWSLVKKAERRILDKTSPEIKKALSS